MGRHKIGSNHHVVVPDDDWSDLAEAARLAGTERSVVVRQLVAGYLGHPEAELPKRPSSAQLAQLLAARSAAPQPADTA